MQVLSCCSTTLCTVTSRSSAPCGIGSGGSRRSGRTTFAAVKTSLLETHIDPSQNNCHDFMTVNNDRTPCAMQNVEGVEGCRNYTNKWAAKLESIHAGDEAMAGIHARASHPRTELVCLSALPSSCKRNRSIEIVSPSSARVELFGCSPLTWGGRTAGACSFCFMDCASCVNRSHFACRFAFTASALFCCSVYSCEHSSNSWGFTSMNSFMALYTMP